MVSAVSIPKQIHTRKRKVHAKSRKGCGNCKLRRVKCDEARPKCNKCISYGVSCNYDGGKSCLDLSAQGSFQIDFGAGEAVVDFRGTSLQHAPVSLNKLYASTINDSLVEASRRDHDLMRAVDVPDNRPPSTWSFTESDLETLARFQTRTIATVVTKLAVTSYRNCIAQLAFDHPFLMHIVLSLTLMHDAHLSTPRDHPLTPHTHNASIYHLTTSTTLFNATLSHPIPPSHRDALWATCSLIGTTTIAYLESSTPTSAWPLKPHSPTDLAWLKLSEGKRTIWDIADLTRPESCFYDLGRQMNHSQRPGWLATPEWDTLPGEVLRLFDVVRPPSTTTPTPTTPTEEEDPNPYLRPLLAIHHILRPDRTFEFEDLVRPFLLYMTPAFHALLERKDPRAMLLMLWWFRRVAGGGEVEGGLWWVMRRARVEGRAIEIWLERWWGGTFWFVEL